MIAIYAILIFVVFAVVGGALVWFIVNNEPERGPDDRPQRGVPRDTDG